MIRRDFFTRLASAFAWFAALLGVRREVPTGTWASVQASPGTFRPAGTDIQAGSLVCIRDGRVWPTVSCSPKTDIEIVYRTGGRRWT